MHILTVFVNIRFCWNQNDFQKDQQFQLKASQADESLIWVWKADIEGRKLNNDMQMIKKPVIGVEYIFKARSIWAKSLFLLYMINWF